MPSFRFFLTRLALMLLAALSGCGIKVESTPDYYIRPAEMADAEKRCEQYGGLDGLGTTAYRSEGRTQITFHASCKKSMKLSWNKP